MARERDAKGRPGTSPERGESLIPPECLEAGWAIWPQMTFSLPHGLKGLEGRNLI